MSLVRCHIAVSADGYVAGPNQSMENPLGEGGEGLHDWMVGLEVWRKAHNLEGGEVSASTSVVEETVANVGAGIMGRNMFFGGGRTGPWDESWTGWWGEDPPYHHPVFVLTHHPREPMTLTDTTFHFVTDGVESAVKQARAAAGDQDVQIHGGGRVFQQCLAAGLVDEFEVHIASVMLGGGTRLLDNLGPNIQLEQIRSVAAPGVTHVKYRVQR